MVEDLDGLWKAIGLHLITERKVLAPKELRFLREHMDMTQAELAAKLRTVKLAPSGWIDLVLKIVIALEGWKLEGVIRRHGYEGSAEQFAKNRERIVAERIDAMSDAEKRAFLVDLLVGDWSHAADKAQQELYKHALKLAGVDFVKVANAAIDEARRLAAQQKK